MSSRLHQNTLREHSGANPHQGSRTSSCLPRAPPCHPDRLASKRARLLAETRRKGPRARFPLEGKAAWSRKPQTQLLFSSEKAAPQRLGFPKCGCSGRCLTMQAYSAKRRAKPDCGMVDGRERCWPYFALSTFFSGSYASIISVLG